MLKPTFKEWEEYRRNCLVHGKCFIEALERTKTEEDMKQAMYLTINSTWSQHEYKEWMDMCVKHEDGTRNIFKKVPNTNLPGEISAGFWQEMFKLMANRMAVLETFPVLMAANMSREQKYDSAEFPHQAFPNCPYFLLRTD